MYCPKDAAGGEDHCDIGCSLSKGVTKICVMWGKWLFGSDVFF